MQNYWSVLSRSGVDAWHFPKEWQEWNPETNTSNHVEQVSFRQCITCREHWQLKGWQPHFQTTVAKSSIWTMTMTMPCTQVENSRPGWERFWTYDFNLTCFPDAFPASSKCTTVISSGLQNSSSWRMNSNYTWTTCSKVGSSAWNSKRERQEGMSETNMSSKSPFGSASHFANIGSWKAGSPISNSLLLKAQSRQSFVGLQQSHSTTESTITAL